MACFRWPARWVTPGRLSSGRAGALVRFNDRGLRISGGTALQRVCQFSRPCADCFYSRAGVIKPAAAGRIQAHPSHRLENPGASLTLKLALPNLAIGFGAATLVPYLNVFFSVQYHFSDAALGCSSVLLAGNRSGLHYRAEIGRQSGRQGAHHYHRSGGQLGVLLMVGFSPGPGWRWLDSLCVAR